MSGGVRAVAEGNFRELEAERPLISEKVFLKCDVSLRF